MEKKMETTVKGHIRTTNLVGGFWVARNEGIDPYSGPCITHCNSLKASFGGFWGGCGG